MRRRHRNAIAVFVGCGFALLAAGADEPMPAQAGDDTMQVLFIGNSYTAHNDLPALVAQMAKAKGKAFECDQHTPDGRTFEQHIMERTALEKIRSRKWDVVVLQNQSLQPVINPDAMLESGLELCKEAKAVGAQVVLYQTWAYDGVPAFIENAGDMQLRRKALAVLPHMQQRLNAAYARLARKAGARVAPVGSAWQAALRQDPTRQLHEKDKSHPTPLGTYLAGLVIYATLFGEPPGEMPESIVPPAVSGDEANALATLVWRICREPQARPD